MIQYTNNYSILKDILKQEYQLILAMLLNNINDSIHLLKKKMPLQGEILEYLYLSVPTYYNDTHGQICDKFRYVDNIIRILYKNNMKNLPREFNIDVKRICDVFHIENNEFQYYYYVAMIIILLENSSNEDAFTLYSQFNEDIKKNLESFLLDLLSMLDKNEFQCLFYNHLEDVYQNNLSIDKKFSLIHENNYSYFLDNVNINNIFAQYLKPIPNKRYPIIITDKYIYNIVDDMPCMLEVNYINTNIFDDRTIRYIASYYMQDRTIRNWIPFFSFFHKYKSDITADIYDAFYNDYCIQYPLNDDSLIGLTNSEPFYYYDESLNNIHYYIDIFSIYSTKIFKKDDEIE